ncbi:hypothetical protein BKH42_06945 [Helicobacter sp. 13S00482-2]|nr:hypothetical protein BKH42_06945 [Helicobacter sp. 13S00482-2]
MSFFISCCKKLISTQNQCKNSDDNLTYYFFILFCNLIVPYITHMLPIAIDIGIMPKSPLKNSKCAIHSIITLKNRK